MPARTCTRGHRHASRTFASSSGASRVAVRAPRLFLCASRHPSRTSTSPLARGPMGRLAGGQTMPFNPPSARAIPSSLRQTIDLGPARPPLPTPTPGRHHMNPPSLVHAADFGPSAAPTSYWAASMAAEAPHQEQRTSSFLSPNASSFTINNKSIILPLRHHTGWFLRDRASAGEYFFLGLQ